MHTNLIFSIRKKKSFTPTFQVIQLFVCGMIFILVILFFFFFISLMTYFCQIKSQIKIKIKTNLEQCIWFTWNKKKAHASRIHPHTNVYIYSRQNITNRKYLALRWPRNQRQIPYHFELNLRLLSKENINILKK